MKPFEKQSNTPHTYISTPITIGALFQGNQLPTCRATGSARNISKASFCSGPGTNAMVFLWTTWFVKSKILWFHMASEYPSFIKKTDLQFLPMRWLLPHGLHRLHRSHAQISPVTKISGLFRLGFKSLDPQFRIGAWIKLFIKSWLQQFYQEFWHIQSDWLETAGPTFRTSYGTAKLSIEPTICVSKLCLMAEGTKGNWQGKVAVRSDTSHRSRVFQLWNTESSLASAAWQCSYKKYQRCISKPNLFDGSAWSVWKRAEISKAEICCAKSSHGPQT